METKNKKMSLRVGDEKSKPKTPRAIIYMKRGDEELTAEFPINSWDKTVNVMGMVVPIREVVAWLFRIGIEAEVAGVEA